MNKLAQINIHPPGGFRGEGPLGLEGKLFPQAPTIFEQTLTLAIGVLTIVAIIWFVFKLITGAYALISSSGDKQQVANAWKNISTALIGLLVVILATFILDLVGELIGIPYILDLAPAIRNLR